MLLFRSGATNSGAVATGSGGGAAAAASPGSASPQPSGGSATPASSDLLKGTTASDDDAAAARTWRRGLRAAAETDTSVAVLEQRNVRLHRRTRWGAWRAWVQLPDVRAKREARLRAERQRQIELLAEEQAANEAAVKAALEAEAAAAAAEAERQRKAESEALAMPDFASLTGLRSRARSLPSMSPLAGRPPPPPSPTNKISDRQMLPRPLSPPIRAMPSGGGGGGGGAVLAGTVGGDTLNSTNARLGRPLSACRSARSVTVSPPLGGRSELGSSTATDERLMRSAMQRTPRHTSRSTVARMMYVAEGLSRDIARATMKTFWSHWRYIWLPVAKARRNAALTEARWQSRIAMRDARSAALRNAVAHTLRKSFFRRWLMHALEIMRRAHVLDAKAYYLEEKTALTMLGRVFVGWVRRTFDRVSTDAPAPAPHHRPREPSLRDPFLRTVVVSAPEDDPKSTLVPTAEDTSLAAAKGRRVTVKKVEAGDATEKPKRKYAQTTTLRAAAGGEPPGSSLRRGGELPGAALQRRELGATYRGGEAPGVSMFRSIGVEHPGASLRGGREAAAHQPFRAGGAQRHAPHAAHGAEPVPSTRRRDSNPAMARSEGPRS